MHQSSRGGNDDARTIRTKSSGAERISTVDRGGDETVRVEMRDTATLRMFASRNATTVTVKVGSNRTTAGGSDGIGRLSTGVRLDEPNEEKRSGSGGGGGKDDSIVMTETFKP